MRWVWGVQRGCRFRRRASLCTVLRGGYVGAEDFFFVPGYLPTGTRCATGSAGTVGRGVESRPYAAAPELGTGRRSIRWVSSALAPLVVSVEQQLLKPAASSVWRLARVECPPVVRGTVWQRPATSVLDCVPSTTRGLGESGGELGHAATRARA